MKKVIIINSIILLLIGCNLKQYECCYTPGLEENAGDSIPIWVLDSSKKDLLDTSSSKCIHSNEIYFSNHDQEGNFLGWVQNVRKIERDYANYQGYPNVKFILPIYLNDVDNNQRAKVLETKSSEEGYCKPKVVSFESYIKFESDIYFDIDTLNYTQVLDDKNNYKKSLKLSYNNKYIYNDFDCSTYISSTMLPHPPIKVLYEKSN